MAPVRSPVRTMERSQPAAPGVRATPRMMLSMESASMAPGTMPSAVAVPCCSGEAPAR